MPKELMTYMCKGLADVGGDSMRRVSHLACLQPDQSGLQPMHAMLPCGLTRKPCSARP